MSKAFTILKDKHTLLFWVGLIISTVIFVTLIHFFSVDFIPYCFLSFLMVMYSLSRIHNEKLRKPCNYIFPIFISLSISFAIISFIFGLHNDVFNSYDNNEPNDADKYKWFRASEVLSFPFSQINCKNSPTTNVIDFSALMDSTPKYHLILVDKTASVTNSDNAINDYILRKIKDRFNVSWQFTQKYKASDLIPPFIVTGLCENLSKSNANENVGFFYYTGYESNLISLNSKSDFFTANLNEAQNNKTSTFINDYFQSIENYQSIYVKEMKAQKVKQITSFADIMASLKNNLQNKPEFKNKHIIVSIISDFINTDSTIKITDFSTIPEISELNLYVLNGKDNENPSSSSLQLIDKMTRNYSHLHEKRTINFQNTKDAEVFYSNLSTANLQYYDHKNDKNLFFYFPYKDFNSNQEAVSEIVFSEGNEGTQDELQYYLKITDLDNQAVHFPIFYNTKQSRDRTVVFSEDLFSVTIRAKDTLRLYLPYTSNYRSDRLFVEISSVNSNKKEALAISFKPTLSETTTYYLIFCYTVFVVSISLILILPNFFVFLLIRRGKVKCDSSFHSIVLSFPLALGVVSLSYYHYLLFTNHLLLPFIFVLFFLLLFCAPDFLSNFKADSEITHEFNAFGTVVSDLKYLFNFKEKLPEGKG